MDFRTAAFLEARKCLKYVDKQDIEQPEFWANLLGAIANASIAAVPDSVADDIARLSDRNRQLQQAMQIKIAETLSGN